MRNANSWRWRLLAIVLLIGTGIMATRPTSGANPAPAAPSAAAKPSDAAAPPKKTPPPVVVARVDGQPIFDLEIERAILPLLAAAPAADKSSPPLRAAVLNQLIDRRVVQAALEQLKIAATPDEVDLEIKHLKADLSRSNQSLDDVLAKTGQTESMLRAELVWQLTWQQYLRQHASDEAVEAYFKAHHRDFDGSQLRVSHILFRPLVAGDEAGVAAMIKQAEEVRRQIQAGEIKFADAAEKYSAGPSRNQGGDLGLIPRHGVMVEPFARAAFALKKGEISPPVATVFGIHLITVTDEKPGEKKFVDVRDAVRAGLAEQLFGQLAARERAKAKIEFTGQAPYFKPGTAELVVPSK